MELGKGGQLGVGPGASLDLESRHVHVDLVETLVDAQDESRWDQRMDPRQPTGIGDQVTDPPGGLIEIDVADASRVVVEGSDFQAS
jgi:hypothetical protein